MESKKYARTKVVVIPGGTAKIRESAFESLNHSSVWELQTKTLGFYDSIPTTIELVLKDYNEKCIQKGLKPENELNELAKNFIVKKHNIQSLTASHKHIYNFYILSVFTS